MDRPFSSRHRARDVGFGLEQSTANSPCGLVGGDPARADVLGQHKQGIDHHLGHFLVRFGDGALAVGAINLALQQLGGPLASAARLLDEFTDDIGVGFNGFLFDMGQICARLGVPLHVVVHAAGADAQFPGYSVRSGRTPHIGGRPSPFQQEHNHPSSHIQEHSEPNRCQDRTRLSGSTVH